MIRIILSTAALAALAACASTPVDVEPATAPPPPPIEAPQSAFDLAMGSVESLVAQGNEQTAVDRLTQLLGNAELTDEERLAALKMRADLRYGEGNDLFGAIEDFDALLDSGLLSPQESITITETRDIARGEATSLNFMLENGNLSRTETFETLFRLGRHEEAVDLMLNEGVTPDNSYLIDLFEIGYLCEGEEFGGPVFNATETDGTPRALQYCDFGK